VDQSVNVRSLADLAGKTPDSFFTVAIEAWIDPIDKDSVTHHGGIGE